MSTYGSKPTSAAVNFWCLQLQIGYLWYVHIYSLDKISYNKLHPYTSWIPITYVILLALISNFNDESYGSWVLVSMFRYLGYTISTIFLNLALFVVGFRCSFHISRHF